MITTRLLGGLGNQMFQYAAGRALAARRGTTLAIDVGVFRGYALHPYGLNHFAIDAQVVDTPQPQGRVGRVWQRLRDTAGGRVYREQGLRFDPRVLELPDHRCLSGYWQSERYFADQAEIIRRDFTMASPPSPETTALLGRIAAGPSISLHVRRGDYVSNAQTQAVHGTCDPGYYERALAHVVPQCAAAPHVFVFSDDPDWAQHNLHTGQATTVVRHNGPERNFDDLRLMSACDHHIIANSSFSWWGAWLDARPQKIVVAPQRWFRSEALDAADIVPADWIRL